MKLIAVLIVVLIIYPLLILFGGDMNLEDT